MSNNGTPTQPKAKKPRTHPDSSSPALRRSGCVPEAVVLVPSTAPKSSVTRARGKKESTTKDHEFPEYGYKMSAGQYVLKEAGLNVDDWGSYERLVLGTGMNYRNDTQPGFETWVIFGTWSSACLCYYVYVFCIIYRTTHDVYLTFVETPGWVMGFFWECGS